jgi:hypothetical protein
VKTILVTCEKCKGSGWRDCGHCHGKGRLPSHDSMAIGVAQTERDCPMCNGLGQRPCTGCGGRGIKHKDIIDPEPTPPSAQRKIVQFKPKDAVESKPTLSKARRQISRLKTKIKRPTQFNAFAPSVTTRAQSPPARTTHIVQYRSPPSSEQIDLIGCAVISALFLLVCILLLFGFDKVLVAGEAFFLFGAWAGLRAASLLRAQQGARLESFRQYMVMCFGLCSGLLVAYLILTTPEGEALTEWVTAQTSRIIGSLFVSVLGLGLLEVAWRRIVAWITN